MNVETLFVPASEFIAEINKISAKNCSSFTTLWGHELPVRVAEYLENIQKVETIMDVEKMFWCLIPHAGPDFAKSMADDLFNFLRERNIERDERSRVRKQKLFSNKTANRARYLHEPTFTFYQRKKGDTTTTRWQGETDLRSMGLLGSMMMDLHPSLDQPIAISLLNGTPRDDEGEKLDVPGIQWEHLLEQDIAVSGERLGWNINTPAWKQLLKCFPIAIDLAAYGHSLNAPLIPGGYIPNINVRLAVLRDKEGNDLETDGSGWYHPDTPELQDLIERHGVCPIQLRFMTTAGVFAKGVLFPCKDSVNLDREPCVTLDWLQVKGSRKSKAAMCRKEDKTAMITGYLGVIGRWNSRAGLKGCFELLENIESNPVTKLVVEEEIDKAMSSLQKRGISGPGGLLSTIAADNPRMDMVLKLCCALKQNHVDLEPTQIPMVRDEVDAKLGRKLRHIGEGAAINFSRYVCRLDSQIAEGTCHISGHEGDLDVAAFRFPLVLAQGLLSLKTVVGPRRLHTSPWTITLNPNDLVTKAQGDDDGDIMGISMDPNHIKMFKHLVDNRIFHVEPKGKKFTKASDSPDGLKYLRYDQRGIVGSATVWRSKLLAIGDIMGANAMSIVIQENIDCAKRDVDWTDWRRAADIRNWSVDERGEYHFSHKLPTNLLDQGDFPMMLCAQWVNNRLRAAGINPKTQNVLGWKWKGKRIIPSQWAPTAVRGDCGVKNLVHHAHDYALSRWLPIADEFKLSGKTLPLAVVIPTLVGRLGGNLNIDALTELSWETYSRNLRARSGMLKFGKEMKKILSRDLSSDDGGADAKRYALIDSAHDALHTDLAALSLEDLSTIWFMELAHEQGNINHAFRAVCWNGSPILKALGIKEETTCDFLSSEKTGLIVKKALGASKPHEWLANAIFSSHKHEQQVTDANGEAIPGWDCKHCCDTLQTGLVVAIRRLRKRKEHQFVANCIRTLNK